MRPLTVSFSSAGTSDPDGDALSYERDFDANGEVDSTQPNATFTYLQGRRLQGDPQRHRRARSAAQYVDIFVGNQPPEVELSTEPGPGDPFHFADTVEFEVSVSDEDPVDCDQVQVHCIVGHDEHGHPISTTAGRTGTIQTTVPKGA